MQKYIITLCSMYAKRLKIMSRRLSASTSRMKIHFFHANFHIIYSDEKPEVMRMFDENDLKEMIMPQNLSILSDKKVKKIQTLLRKSKTIKLSPYAFDLFVADRKKLQENFVVTTLSMNQGSV